MLKIFYKKHFMKKYITSMFSDKKLNLYMHYICIYIYILYIYMYNAVCIMKLYEYINNETTPYYVSNIMILANLALK